MGNLIENRDVFDGAKLVLVSGRLASAAIAMKTATSFRHSANASKGGLPCASMPDSICQSASAN